MSDEPDEPRHKVWADGEVHPIKGWVGPVAKRTAPGTTIDCVRCASMMFNRYYELWQEDKSSIISVCTTCCLVLQHTGAIVAEDYIYQVNERHQRDLLQKDFRDPAQWRAAQFVLHLPDNVGMIVEGAVIDLDDFEAYVQIVNFNGLWFWKGKFLDVFRSGDEAFGHFEEAADHALKALLYWHDRL